MILDKHSNYTEKEFWWSKAKQCGFPLLLKDQNQNCSLATSSLKWTFHLNFVWIESWHCIHRWDEQTVAIPVVTVVNTLLSLKELPVGDTDVVQHFLWGHYKIMVLPVKSSSQVEPTHFLWGHNEGLPAASQRSCSPSQTARNREQGIKHGNTHGRTDCRFAVPQLQRTNK